MKSAYFAICYQCNHKCIFCPRDLYESKETLDLSTIQSNIRKLKKEKEPFSVIISGGEPTLHPDFFEIVCFLLNERIPVSLLSNGELFNNSIFAEKFIQSFANKPINVITAIHSIDPNKHDHITQSKGSWERSLHGLKILSDNGVATTIKFIISKLNYSETKEFIQYIYEAFQGKASINICGIDCAGNAGNYAEEAAIGFIEMKGALDEALDYYESILNTDHVFRVYLSELPLCSTDPSFWRHFSLHSRDNQIAYSAPNYNGNNEHLLLSPINDCYPFAKQCKKCKLYQICPGMWRTTFQQLGEGCVRPFTD